MDLTDWQMRKNDRAPAARDHFIKSLNLTLFKFFLTGRIPQKLFSQNFDNRVANISAWVFNF